MEPSLALLDEPFIFCLRCVMYSLLCTTNEYISLFKMHLLHTRSSSSIFWESTSQVCWGHKWQKYEEIIYYLVWWVCGGGGKDIKARTDRKQPPIIQLKRKMLQDSKNFWFKLKARKWLTNSHSKWWQEISVLI